MGKQTWLECLDQARAAGLAGAVLTFNTGDRVFQNLDGRPVVAGLKYFLASKYGREGLHVGYFSLASGFRELAPPGVSQNHSSPFNKLEGTENPIHVFRAMEPILKDPHSRCVLLVDYADHVAGADHSNGRTGDADNVAVVEILHSWSNDDDIRRSGNFVVLICREDGLHSLLRYEGAFRPVTVDLPGLDARRMFVTQLLQVRDKGLKSRIGTLAGDFPVYDFAVAAGGLRLMDIEALLLESAACSMAVTRDSVRKRKKHAIGQLCHGLLEVCEPVEGFESVAGCYAAKSYFSAIAPLWHQGHGSMPQGILLAGVPGAGKSFLIKALAKEFASPCLVLRGIREPWVGQSERNLDLVLKVADSLAPCLLWTDEVDQQGTAERAAGPSGDSGVNQRMMARLLEFFGDASIRGRILWIATTNRPDLLDAAFRDRFSVKVPFLHPSASERAKLLPVLARQVGRALGADIDCAAISRRSELEMLSVRGLQEIVVWAGTLSDIGCGSTAAPITARYLERAIDEYKPAVDPVEQELIALISLRMASFHTLLPWVGMDGFKPAESEWPSYVDPLIDRRTGKLDPERLRLRIQELQALRAHDRVLR